MLVKVYGRNQNTSTSPVSFLIWARVTLDCLKSINHTRELCLVISVESLMQLAHLRGFFPSRSWSQ